MRRRPVSDVAYIGGPSDLSTPLFRALLEWFRAVENLACAAGFGGKYFDKTIDYHGPDGTRVPSR